MKKRSLLFLLTILCVFPLITYYVSKVVRADEEPVQTTIIASSNGQLNQTTSAPIVAGKTLSFAYPAEYPDYTLNLEQSKVQLQGQTISLARTIESTGGTVKQIIDELNGAPANEETGSVTVTYFYDYTGTEPTSTTDSSSGVTPPPTQTTVTSTEPSRTTTQPTGTSETSTEPAGTATAQTTGTSDTSTEPAGTTTTQTTGTSDTSTEPAGTTTTQTTETSDTLPATSDSVMPPMDSGTLPTSPSVSEGADTANSLSPDVSSPKELTEQPGDEQRVTGAKLYSDYKELPKTNMKKTSPYFSFAGFLTISLAIYLYKRKP